MRTCVVQKDRLGAHDRLPMSTSTHTAALAQGPMIRHFLVISDCAMRVS